MDLITGGVYRIDLSEIIKPDPWILNPRTIFYNRVIMFDQFEVFSDWRFPNELIWHLDQKLKNLYTANRSSRKSYDRYATQIGFEPFRAEVMEFIKPDLLLRIGRIKDLCWNDDVFNDQRKFTGYINDKTSKEWQEQVLSTDRIYLEPLGAKGGSKPAEEVIADNGTFFTVAELLWKAKQIRTKVNKAGSDGVGIFRSNFRNKKPVYYIGNYYDEAGTLKEYEDEGVNTNL